MQQCTRIYYSMFIWSLACFERHTAHHQELKNCTGSLWFYIRVRLLDVEVAGRFTASSKLNVQQPHMYVKPESVSAFFELLMMSGVSLETCWASYKHRIINSGTLLHLVDYFYMNYTMMHWSTNIKFRMWVFTFTFRQIFFSGKLLGSHWVGVGVGLGAGLHVAEERNSAAFANWTSICESSTLWPSYCIDCVVPFCVSVVDNYISCWIFIFLRCDWVSYLQFMFLVLISLDCIDSFLFLYSLLIISVVFNFINNK
jgi:hypothetical protein